MFEAKLSDDIMSSWVDPACNLSASPNARAPGVSAAHSAFMSPPSNWRTG